MKHLFLAFLLAFSTACATTPVALAPVVQAFKPDDAQIRFAYGIGYGMAQQAGFPDPDAVGQYVVGFAEIVVKSPPVEPYALALEAATAAAQGLHVPDELVGKFAQAGVDVARTLLSRRPLPSGIRPDVVAVSIAVSHVALLVVAANQQAPQPQVKKVEVEL